MSKIVEHSFDLLATEVEPNRKLRPVAPMGDPPVPAVVIHADAESHGRWS